MTDPYDPNEEPPEDLVDKVMEKLDEEMKKRGK